MYVQLNIPVFRIYYCCCKDMNYKQYMIMLSNIKKIMLLEYKLPLWGNYDRNHTTKDNKGCGRNSAFYGYSARLLTLSTHYKMVKEYFFVLISISILTNSFTELWSSPNYSGTSLKFKRFEYIGITMQQTLGFVMVECCACV